VPGVLAHGVVRCPTCGAEDLETVNDGDDTNFLCVACRSCWHVELGWVQRVDPHGCERCPHRGGCLERLPE
jgi:transposase-like protein